MTPLRARWCFALLCISLLVRLREQAPKPLYHPNPHSLRVTITRGHKPIKQIFSLISLVIKNVLYVYFF